MTTTTSIIPNRIEWNLTGKTIIITGASSGLGKATALELAKMGMRRLILACKNVAAGEKAAVEIREGAGGLAPDVVAVRQLDLSSLDSIRMFAHDIVTHEPDLHILINNAGYFAGPDRKMTKDGFEQTFAINYIGHYLLTLLLLKLLKRSAPSRIVNITTGPFWLRLAKLRGFRVNDPNFDKSGTYTPVQAYCLSKLATILFTRSLHRHLHPLMKDDMVSFDPVDLQLAAALPCSLSLDPSRIFGPQISTSNSAPMIAAGTDRYSEMLAEDKPRPVAEEVVKSPSSSADRRASVVPKEPAESRRTSIAPVNSISDRRKSSVAPTESLDNRRKSIATPTEALALSKATNSSLTPLAEQISPAPANETGPEQQLNIVKKPGKRPEVPVVSVFAVSPGSFLRTDLYKRMPPSKRRLMAGLRKSPEIGAIMAVYCASASGIENASGKYFVKCHPVDPPSVASNDALAMKLWEMSARLVDDATNKMILGFNSPNKAK